MNRHVRAGLLTCLTLLGMVLVAFILIKYADELPMIGVVLFILFAINRIYITFLED